MVSHCCTLLVRWPSCSPPGLVHCTCSVHPRLYVVCTTVGVCLAKCLLGALHVCVLGEVIAAPCQGSPVPGGVSLRIALGLSHRFWAAAQGLNLHAHALAQPLWLSRVRRRRSNNGEFVKRDSLPVCTAWRHAHSCCRFGHSVVEALPCDCLGMKLASACAAGYTSTHLPKTGPTGLGCCTQQMRLSRTAFCQTQSCRHLQHANA